MWMCLLELLFRKEVLCLYGVKEITNKVSTLTVMIALQWE